MHADIFRYVVLVYAFAFVAMVAFDTEQRFLKWGHEQVAQKAQPVPAKVPSLKHVVPADNTRAATSPETAKDI